MRLLLTGLAASSWLAVLASANVDVRELDGTEEITDKIIYFEGRDDGTMEPAMVCPRGRGTQFTFNEDRSIVACCLPGQHLSGSRATAWDCCAAGHSLAGSEAAGYRCCPNGQVYDGSMCKQLTPVCRNGRTLVDGECVCPDGTVERADGTCGKDSAECSSGIREGKCYIMKMENGNLLGYNGGNGYVAADEYAGHAFGKFKFCMTKTCDGGGAIDPSDGFRIHDMHGDRKAGSTAMVDWLGENHSGDHIKRTPLWEKAGIFSVTKYGCGKYCLSGLDHGLGPACPASKVSITFRRENPQLCRQMELVEVPCDIRADANNCMWEKAEGTC